MMAARCRTPLRWACPSCDAPSLTSTNERHHVDIDPRRIVITAGGSAALLLATALTVDPGDEVIVADPSYPRATAS